jgi:hypothetical protein
MLGCCMIAHTDSVLHNNVFVQYVYIIVIFIKVYAWCRRL